MCLGVPGRIVKVVEVLDQQPHLATADISGVQRDVNVGLLVDEPGGIGVGDWVLVHVGFAMAKIDEEEARATRQFLEELGDPYHEELAEIKESAAG